VQIKYTDKSCYNIEVLNSILKKIASNQTQTKVEKFVIIVGLAGFIIHLLAIFLTYQLNIFPVGKTFLSPSYFSAITTPLNVILFYEIYLLVLSIPYSIILSVLKQMEIVALIVVREVFKLLSTVDDFNKIFDDNGIAVQMALLFSASILAFLLVAIFQKFVKKSESSTSTIKSDRFTSLKYLTTLMILVLLVVFISGQILNDAVFILTGSNFVNKFDYVSLLFIVMIFVDVFIFMISLFYSEDFGFVFLESSMILISIFLRLGVTFEYTDKVITILFAMACAIIVLLIYMYAWLGKELKIKKNV